MPDSAPSPTGTRPPVGAPARRARLSLPNEVLADALVGTAAGIVVQDVEGVVRFLNPAAERMLGRSSARMLGQHRMDPGWGALGEDGRLLGADHHPALIALRDGAEVSGAILGVRSDEEEPRWLEVSSRPIELTDGPGVVSTLSDVTDRRRLEIQAHALTRERSALARVAAALAREPEPEPDELFSVVADEIASLFDADVGLVFRYDGPMELEVVASTATGAPGVGTRVSLAESPLAEMVRGSGGAARIDDDARMLSLGERRYPSRVAAPVRVEGRLWGVLLAGCDTLGGFGRGVEERLSRFADLLGMAIGRVEGKASLVSNTAADAFVTRNDGAQTLQAIAEAAARALGADRASCYVHGSSIERPITEIYTTETDPRRLAFLRDAIGARRENLELLSHLLAAPEGCWAVEDASNDLTVGEDLAKRLGSAAFLGLRLETPGGSKAAGDALLGTLFVTFHEPRRFEASELRAARGFAAVATSAVADARLRERALASIRLLARVVDAKDRSTLRHSERVADLARRLAGAAGWSPERAASLAEAALVHDVGKVGVSDAVLFKPGALSDDEYEQVKQHAALGAEIVSEVLRPEQVAWVRHHHERWDGLGYPDGLAAQEIPEGACLLAVADSWDVMRSARDYSRAMGGSEALAECRRSVGTHFSPAAVAALGRVIDTGTD